MKRMLHVLVPLLLIALIVFSIGWYFLEYDPDLTRDLLLQQARYQDQVGNHAAAVWFYDLAYLQSDKDDDVALELAQQYISAGNYTKAEYTLSHAISDGGSIDLYIALCDTYVAQNKLLDAVTMLNNIADPNIKAQLDAIRPEAPSPSHAAGTYSQHIHLGFTAAGGSCYISADKTYPSLTVHAYEQPFTLPQGETVFYGLTVADNGLVSPLGIYSYVIGGIIEEVTFKNTEFEQALRTQLGFAQDRVIYSNELWDVKEFEIPATVQDYSDLRWLPNLEKLAIASGSAPDLKDIAQLSKLQVLIISETVLSSSDLQIIAELPDLTRLTMYKCQLSSIANLAGAKKLTYLDIRENAIRDLSALRGMAGLKELYLDNNAVISLEAISGLTALEVLMVSHNSLTTTSHVSRLVNLLALDVSYNGLMDLAGVENLTKLQEFFATNNNLVSIDALAGCTDMRRLNVSYNTILSLEPVAGMLKLEELNFNNNEVSVLPQFSKDCALWGIAGDYNQIESLEPLSGLHHLSYVYMDYNGSISSVDCLKYCHLLITVSVYGTAVRDVQVLKDMSVTVYYDPT